MRRARCGDNRRMTEIQSKLAAFIADKIMKQPGRAIKPDESLIKSGKIDSFSLVDVGLFIEDEFNLRIDDVYLTADLMDTLELMEKAIVSRQ
jgi:acyl carrier protein